MTKKDYELIAGIFKDQIKTWGEVHGNSERKLSLEIMADALADTLAYDNPKFDRNKFLIACGVETEQNPFDLITHVNGKAIKR